MIVGSRGRFAKGSRSPTDGQDERSGRESAGATAGRRNRRVRFMIMKPGSQKLVDEALALPEEERLEIATRLLASVEGPDDAAWEASWLAEMERRRSDAESSRTSASDWSEARARILERLDRRR